MKIQTSRCFLARLAARRQRRTAAVATALVLVGGLSVAVRADDTWTGGGATPDWSDAGNWTNGTPDTAPYGTLFFSSTTNSPSNDDIAQLNENALIFNASAAGPFTINGIGAISLFDNAGAQARIENNAGAGNASGLFTLNNATINFAATSGATFGEINAVTGGLLFGANNTLNISGSQVAGIKLFGAGQTTTFNNTVNATGKYFATTAAGTTVAIGGTFTSGDFYLMNTGTLNVSGNGFTTSALRLGGDFGTTGNQNQTLGGTFNLTDAAGGQTFGSTINSVGGNTSGALAINSQNTSGTNTLSGSIFLDSALTISQTGTGGAGILALSGTTDVKAQTLTLGGVGTTNVTGALTSSLAAGGTLVKTGVGTVILQNTANTFSGTSAASLNANSTQIAAGTLGIYGDGSLGVVPGGAYNNIQFTGSGTLQDTANNVTLAATRNISVVSGATAAFDSNGNTFTIGGVINGSGNVAKLGSGTVILTGANIYTGTTTVTGTTTATSTSAGTLTIGTGGSIGSSTTRTGAVTVGAGGNFTVDGGSLFASTLTVATPNTTTVAANASLLNGGTINLSGGLFVATGNNSNAASLLTLTGGTLTANSVLIGRTNLAVLSAAAAGSTTNGIYVNGGTLNVTTTLSLGTSSNSNSNANFRMDSGSTTVGGLTTVTQNNTRPSFLDVNGGTFTAGTGGIVLGGSFAAAAGQALVRGTGVLNTSGIAFGTATQTSGTNTLTLANTGILNVGSGGFTSASTGTNTINLGGGTIAAAASFSSAAAIGLTLTGGATSTIRAANAAGTAFNVTINGSFTNSGTNSTLLLTGGGTTTLAGNVFLSEASATGRTLIVGVASGANGVISGGISNFNGTGTAGLLQKSGPGTLTLSAPAASNTFTGAITVRGGTLQVGTASATAGGLTGNNALNFSGTGTFNYVGSTAGSTQTMGAQGFTAGEDTIQSTNSGGTSILTLGTPTRSTGGAANYVVNGGTNGSTNSIVSVIGTTNALANRAYYFGGTDFAVYNGSYIRALNYGTDTATVAPNTITAANNVKLTTTPAAAQASISLVTLNLQGSGVSYPMAAGSTLTLSGGSLIKSGGGTASTISGGTALAPTGEFVIRTDVAADALDIQVPVTSATSLNKNGAGTLTLSGANTYTGTTFINNGTLKVDTESAAGTAKLGGTTAVTIQLGGTLLLANSGGSTSTDRINNAATVALNGGTINTGGLQEGTSSGAAAATTGLGALTLSNTSSTTSFLDFGAGHTGSSVLAFANSSASTWGTSLTLLNFTPNTDYLNFASNTGLTSTQLGQISLSGFTATSLDTFGNVVFGVVPEPTTIFGGLLMVGALGFHGRRYLSSVRMSRKLHG